LSCAVAAVVGLQAGKAQLLPTPLHVATVSLLPSDIIQKAALEGDAGRGPDAAAAKPVSLYELVSTYGSSIGAMDTETECLAGAVFFESKGEPLEGQLAVAQVILNRTTSGGRFPGSICSVVKQPGQFSFVRNGAIPAIARPSRAWREAAAIARIARDELWSGNAPRALFFHARRVSPNWRLKQVAAIGNHVFYR
jgi:N-acetylmuramoyl-L-alanine amidase